MNMRSLKNFSKTRDNIISIHLSIVLRKQLRLAHLTALGAALTNSLVYFLQCGTFGYGKTLVVNGEVGYTTVYR